jgi:hypothetical protein
MAALHIGHIFKKPEILGMGLSKPPSLDGDKVREAEARVDLRRGDEGRGLRLIMMMRGITEM